ncbi:MAG TPA: EamA family transporter [Acidimicrobiales bacterium]|nr:EamA family transporter [Acidimicrobiales bacterium]
MTATAFALAVAAAVLHASWNLVVKASGDRLVAACAQATFGAVVFLPFLVLGGIPEGAITPALASSVCHVAYYLGLVTSYRHADISIAYPVARGSAPMLVAIGGTLFVGDHLNVLSWVGIGVVSASLLALAAHLRSWTQLRWPLATGVIIATYTLIDSSATRRVGDDRMGYVALLFALTIVWFIPLVANRRGTRVLLETVRAGWIRLAVAGAASVTSYALVLIAATRAPVGTVAAVRETSVVFAVLGGRLLLREDVRARRALSAVGVAAGAVLLAFS